MRHVSLMAAALATAMPVAPLIAQSGPSGTQMSAPATLPVGTCINLGNTLELEDEGAHGTRPASADDFARIAAAGFTTVRLPVRWDTHSSGTPPYTIDPAWLDRVAEVVDMGLAAGLNIILDSHHFMPIHDDPAGVAPWHGAVWQQVAERFADYPEDRLWFELENEPHGKFTNENLLATLAPALAAVRKSNPTRPVIYGGGEWSGIDSLATLPLPNDPNIYPTFHYYEPFEFTHQGASWVEPEPPQPGRSYGQPEDAARLKADVAKIEAYAKRTGKLPFMGETGAYPMHVPLDQRVAYTRAVVDAFAPLGMGICTWAYTNTFAFWDSDTQQWQPGLLGALGLTEPSVPQAASGETPQSVPTPPAQTAAPAPAFDTSKPPKGRRLDAQLEQFDAQLPGHLMNDPASLEWDSYGTGLTRTAEQDETIPGGGAAVKYVVGAAGDPWSSAVNVPLLGDLEEGRLYTVGFWARSLSSEAEDGLGRLGVRFQRNAAPYPGFGDTTLTIGKEWKFYEVSGIASTKARRKDALLVFQLGAAKQTIEIGQTIVLADVLSVTG